VKVLALPRYGSDVASSRYRLYQFLPYLEAAGVECMVRPLLPEGYMSRRFSRPWRLAAGSLLGAFRRARLLRAIGPYDVVWLEKEGFPFLPWPIERLLLARARPYVVDFDDAWSLRYEEHPNPAVRALLRNKIADVIRAAAATVVGSGYLYEFASGLSNRVEWLPTVVDLGRYPATPAPAPAGHLTVGWIGTHSTEAFLRGVGDVLARFCTERSARFLVIGGSGGDPWFEGMEVVPWSEQTEAVHLSRLDVGIMPLDETPSARGKCALKAIQYMASWKPVVASPVGETPEVVQDGITGLLAKTSEDWYRALCALGDQPSLRQSMGHAGRARVAERYSLAVAAPRLVEILQGTATRGKGP
jgi:glycosyltransferase involved in cell wall biosynthesis